MNSRPKLTLMALCGLMAAGRASIPAQEPGVTTVTAKTSWAVGEFLPLEPQSLELKDTPPEGVDVPPGLKGGQFAQAVLGTNQALNLALDPRPGSEAVWVDREIDGNFRQDQALSWQKDALPWHVDASLEYRVPSLSKPVDLPLRLHYATALRKQGIQYDIPAYLHGEVQLGDRLHAFVVIDSESKLRFDRREGIVILFDGNSDGRFDLGEQSPERIAAGQPVFAGGQAWDVFIDDDDASTLSFKPNSTAQAPAPVWEVTPQEEAAAAAELPKEDFDILSARFEQIRKDGRGPLAETVAALGAFGNEAAFKLLDSLAKDKKAKTYERKLAVAAMGNPAFLAVGSKKLQRYANDKDEVVATTAMAALERMGDPEREATYLKLMKSRKEGIAKVALRLLAHVGTPSAVEAVVAAVGDDKFGRESRLAAYEGLRELPAGPPPAGLEAAASSTYPPLNARGLEDLFFLRGADAAPFARAAAAERVHTPQQLEIITRVLAAVADPESLQALMAMDTGGDAGVHELMRKLLGTLRRPAAVEALATGLDAKDEAVRILTASILGVIPIEASAQALAARVGHEREDAVKQAMLEALGQLPFPASVEALMAEAKDSGPQHVTAVRALAQAGRGSAEVQQLMASLLETTSWEDQVMAIEAVRDGGNVGLAKPVVPLLGHDEWPVRLAAIECLETLRSKDWVPALIERLAQEPRLRLRLALGHALFIITGQSSYWDADTWRKWWSQAGGEFVMAAEPPEPPGSHAGDTVVGAFFGIRLESDRAVFVIDKSGSMVAPGNPGKGTRTHSRNRMEEAIDEVLTAVAGLADDAEVNVIMFSSGVRAWQKRLTDLDAHGRKDLEDYLHKQRADGGTNLFDGLAMALEMEGVDKILLLSDGQPSEGRFIAEEDILREVRLLNQSRRVVIDCVSLGGDSRLLRRLAEQNGGSYVGR